MKIAVLGTGTVGATIGTRLIELKHSVMMGSRTTNNEKAATWVQSAGDHASSGTFAEAAAFGEIIFNCTKGDASLDALSSAAEGIKGKILIDVSNPLDFSKGMPPCLIPELSNTNSLGETIQKKFPDTQVVKTLNTMWCGLMVNPKMIANGDHTNFICGNDTDAKKSVKELLISFGWKAENLIDLGDITSARGVEAVLPVWLRIWGATGNGAFNLKVVTQ